MTSIAVFTHRLFCKALPQCTGTFAPDMVEFSVHRAVCIQHAKGLRVCALSITDPYERRVPCTFENFTESPRLCSCSAGEGTERPGVWSHAPHPLALDSWGATMVNFTVGSMDLESARRHSFRYVREGVSGEA